MCRAVCGLQHVRTCAWSHAPATVQAVRHGRAYMGAALRLHLLVTRHPHSIWIAFEVALNSVWRALLR
jgi:hypothetical protein